VSIKTQGSNDEIDCVFDSILFDSSTARISIALKQLEEESVERTKQISMSNVLFSEVLCTINGMV